MKNNKNRRRRHLKVRKKVIGTTDQPRLTVFRSNKITYAQIIDDSQAKTLLSADSAKLSAIDTDEKQTKKIASAAKAGEKLASIALKKKITKVVFDRGGYKFHGRIKALAQGARKGGLEF